MKSDIVEHQWSLATAEGVSSFRFFLPIVLIFIFVQGAGENNEDNYRAGYVS